MGNNRTVFTVDIDAEVSKLKQKLDIAKKGLENFGKNESIDQLGTKFSDLEVKLKKIAEANGTKLDQGGFEKLLNEISKVDKGLNEITGAFKEIKHSSKDNKEGFFPQEIVTKIKSAETAMSQYEAKIRAAAEEAKALLETKRVVEQQDKKIEQNQKKQTTLQSQIATATKREAAIRGELAKIAARKANPKEAGNIEALTKAEKEYKKELKANKELIGLYQDQMGQLQQEENSLNSEHSESVTKLKALESAQQRNGTTSQQLQKAYSELLNRARQLDNSFNDLDDEYSDGNEEKLLARLKSLKNQGFESLDNSLDETIASLRQCSEAEKDLKHNVESSLSAVQKQDQAMGDISSIQSRIQQYIGMEGIINALARSLRNAFEAVKELDASMTEMAVVTNLDVGDYWEQLPIYTQRASELGLAINDVYQADVLYYQQGLKTNEVIAISTETMKMAKIAGLDTADATDKMTAALRGFNMELSETSAKNVADVYSELAAITASDVKEISSAMTKTASIASSAGMEFETTAAFLSQIIETTRESAETAGTAMKTVIARFQELKKSPDEIGEVDGEIVDANKIEGALRTVGVALRDASGQFRDLDDVFLELASKWDSLDKNTQRYIATIAAGSRQQSRFIAMMSDYARTQELVSAANDSAGASNKQFEKTLESLETKLNKLKNAWNTFTMGILDNKVIKFVIDALTALLNAINTVFEALDNIPILGVVARVGLVVGSLVLLDKILKNFFLSLKSGNGVLASAGAALRGYAIDSTGARIAVAKETKAIKNGTRGHYEWIVAAEMAKGATRKQAQEIAKKAMIEANSNLITQTGTKLTLKDMWATIKKTVADKIQTITLYASAVALKIKAMFTKKDQAATMASIPADVAKAASVGLIVAIVLLAIIAFAALVVGILALCGVFNTASKRLEKANKELEATEEAVNKVTEEYNNLGTALDELGNKYDTLEELQRGTEEWNKAVQETNDSVLDLIDTYPELASLVENKGGVLTLDVDSEEVQQIMQEKENQMLTAKGALTGAKLNVAQLNAEAQYESLTDVMDDFSNGEDEWAGVGTFIGTALAGAGAGAAAGASIGAVTGAGVGALPGLIIGGIVGLVSGIFTGIEAKKAVLRANEVIEENLTDLSKAYAKGEAGTTKQDMVKYIEAQGIAVGSAAEEMADNFFKNKEELLEYGRTLNETEAQQKAYYLSLATNAQQMLDLGAYTQKQIDQMSQVVDEDITKAYYEAEKKLIDNMSGDELEQARKEFAKSAYGQTARVDGDKILDELGNVLMTFENDEGWATQMAAAKATQKAAESMQKVPDMISKALEALKIGGNIGGGYKAVEKVLSGQSLTLNELDEFQGALGESTFYDENDKLVGNRSEVTQKFENSPELQNIYGTVENYLKTLDEDSSGVKAMWDKLGPELQNSMYNGDYELFEQEFLKDRKQEVDQWSKSLEYAGQLGITKDQIANNLDSSAAQAWFSDLRTISFNENDVKTVNSALMNMLDGLTDEQATVLMTELNSMDKMDLSVWEDLDYAFEKLKLNIPTAEIEAFVAAGKDAANAVRKIDFTTLSNDINETYKLLDKIKEGGRSYSEEDYKKIIQSNNKLEKSFKKIGDEFIFVGGSMKELTDAVQKNTVATLDDANAQLFAKTEMSKIIADNMPNFADPNNMNDSEQLINYLSSMRENLIVAGYDLSIYGQKGLDNSTQFSDQNISLDQLKEWAKFLATEGANQSLYENEYAEGMRDTNIQYYTHNTSLYNAQQAASGSEFADEHAEALILQAIESGGVTNSMIEAYRQALESNDINKIADIGKQISDSVDEILEESKGRDAYLSLVKQVEDGIVKLREDEIDRLNDINDSIVEANDKLVNKIQEQINEDRTARENAENEEKISDMRSRLAYLGADTSNANILAMLELQQELSDAEQEIRDTKIDQALENLQKANEYAAEQRSEQIHLLEEQLENDKETGVITKQATEIVETGLVQVNNGITASATKMGAIILAAQKWDVLNEHDRDKIVSKLQDETVDAADWFKEDTLSLITNSTGDITAKYANARSVAAGKAVQAFYSGDKTAYSDAATEYTVTYGDPNVDAATRQNNFIKEFSQNMEDRRYEVNEALKRAKGGETELSDDLKKKKKAVENYDSFVHGKTSTWASWQPDFQQVGMDYTSNAESGKPLQKNTFVPGEYCYAHTKKTMFDFECGEVRSDSDELEKWAKELWGISEAMPGTFGFYEGQLVAKGESGWMNMKDRPRVSTGKDDDRYLYDGDSIQALKDKIGYTAYKTGGLADFTGPAWLDGTKSKPEMVLNQKDTANFIVLKDILSEILDGTGSLSQKESQNGDNYFNIDINVEKLEDDYDVEQLADKIRRMIYDDATYRNVNTINLIR